MNGVSWIHFTVLVCVCLFVCLFIHVFVCVCVCECVCVCVCVSPLQISTSPTIMMRQRARSFPTVKKSWMRVAQRTLEQFTHVRNTRDTQTHTYTRIHTPLTHTHTHTHTHT